MMMKGIRGVFAAVFLLVFAGGAGGLEFSGVLDSTVTLGAGTGDMPDFFYGLEEYANLRMQGKLREGLSFYGALNLVAAAGNPARGAALLGAGNAYPGLASSGFIAGENYVAGMELERLYFRVNGEHLDAEGGLLRIPLGYGQVWGSSDFLNPKNPLFPDARPRAVLGGSLSAYPLDSLRLGLFGAAPKNPLDLEGGGGLAGFSADQHWDRGSVQVLYAFESPKGGSPRGIHRWGLSLKADLEAGFTADMLYTWNPEDPPGWGGLSFSGGFDYSFPGGKCQVQAEYLYSGAASSTSIRSGNLTGLSNEHYLYGALTWRFSDFSSLNLGAVAAWSDLSFSPIIGAEHELFQGLTLSLSGHFFLDRDLLSLGPPGELGTLPPGASGGRRFLLSARARLRF
jgi:hypothetical protein